MCVTVAMKYKDRDKIKYERVSAEHSGDCLVECINSVRKGKGCFEWKYNGVEVHKKYLKKN